MIERYLNPEINSIWDDQNKFDTWKLVQEKYVETLEEFCLLYTSDAADE